MTHSASKGGLEKSFKISEVKKRALEFLFARKEISNGSDDYSSSEGKSPNTNGTSSYYSTIPGSIGSSSSSRKSNRGQIVKYKSNKKRNDLCRLLDLNQDVSRNLNNDNIDGFYDTRNGMVGPWANIVKGFRSFIDDSDQESKDMNDAYLNDILNKLRNALECTRDVSEAIAILSSLQLRQSCSNSNAAIDIKTHRSCLTNSLFDYLNWFDRLTDSAKSGEVEYLNFLCHQINKRRRFLSHQTTTISSSSTSLRSYNNNNQTTATDNDFRTCDEETDLESRDSKQLSLRLGSFPFSELKRFCSTKSERRCRSKGEDANFLRSKLKRAISDVDCNSNPPPLRRARSLTFDVWPPSIESDAAVQVPTEITRPEMSKPPHQKVGAGNVRKWVRDMIMLKKDAGSSSDVNFITDLSNEVRISESGDQSNSWLNGVLGKLSPFFDKSKSEIDQITDKVCIILNSYKTADQVDGKPRALKVCDDEMRAEIRTIISKNNQTN